MADVIGRTVRAWLAAGLALVVAAAGMSALTASSSSSSLTRIGIAAGVLSTYAAAVAIVTTPRGERTRWRCLVWGGGVPIMIAVVTMALVGATAGLSRGLVAALPWVIGAVIASVVGPFLPTLRLPGFISSAVASGRLARQRGR